MSRNRTYRCLNCLEHTVSRTFDVSHLSVTCPSCDSFERFVNDAVFQQFRAFEESPPAEIDWERLDRTEKLVVAERLVRSTKTLADFDVVEGDAPVGGREASAGEASAETGEAPAEGENRDAPEGGDASTENEDAVPESGDTSTESGGPTPGDGEASAGD
ncbi:hypothetical protein ACFQMF_04925 [Halorubrum rutilum]|uniref:Uncharacterized protein n=1 Tax=Halorubrum rutilum TaxID=1364933 RepID=A0ABD6AKA2_9EURY|nr:hypothetical protein [Halorubrum rutilum]